MLVNHIIDNAGGSMIAEVATGDRLVNTRDIALGVHARVGRVRPDGTISLSAELVRRLETSKHRQAGGVPKR